MWANFINPPHIRSRMRAICGSHEPSFPSEDSNMEAAAHLEAINDEQKQHHLWGLQGWKGWVYKICSSVEEISSNHIGQKAHILVDFNGDPVRALNPEDLQHVGQTSHHPININIFIIMLLPSHLDTQFIKKIIKLLIIMPLRLYMAG